MWIRDFSTTARDAVIPATVGVDIGCFTGDTLVPTLDGKSYPLRELAESDKEIVVYACTESGKVGAAKATAKKTRTNAELIKVILDNGAGRGDSGDCRR